MSKQKFELVSNFSPSGDQPKAIKKILKGFSKNKTKQVLLGVTGSGKTFTISNVIQTLNKPTIVLVHNKTLASQLYQELKDFFPKNRVEYFVSYYDYYQPEAYVPSTDTYIEKDLAINPKIEQMRLSATEALLTRSDTIIVASVSAIYGLGNPKSYRSLATIFKINQKISRKKLMGVFLDLGFERNELELKPGNFRVRGNVIDIIPSYSQEIIRFTLGVDSIKNLEIIETKNFTRTQNLEKYYLFPANHFVTDTKTQERAIKAIKKELIEILPTISDPLVKHRLKQRTNYDLEMIKELGYCKGIENYSRYLDNRKQGERPYCLLDYFPKDLLIIIDESHQMLPQVRGMYKGDYSRKKMLVDYGFRLPCAFDNRPLKFEEFQKFLKNVIYVSATPDNFEIEKSDQVVEQIIRPTGLIDPKVLTHPIKGQMEHLIKEIEDNTKKGYRSLVTTLTKRLAEELTEYLSLKGVKVRYLHSEIQTLERSEIIRQLRLGEFDCLIGINLLREGLDIPEVAFIGILDADKEGFLRNEKSLIQTIGRAARNSESKVILYLDKITKSVKKAMEETKRRRNIQIRFNKEHNITPKTIIKPVKQEKITDVKDTKHIAKKDIPNMIIDLEYQMNRVANNLEFELAIELRDKVSALKKRLNE
ncbi:MAG: excinuclease ABC subunit UvrB [Candidatus Altiarchaeota archaeon]|nr:excinuclease ABC subunit UvrB [Candidatus Altiarchaeota archaeon]